MGLQDIIDAAEAVGDRDETRQSTFREEFEAYEAGEAESFPQTREAIAAERTALEELAAELDAEQGNIYELVERTEFLTVDQAVRHRERTVEKLRAHNEHLREFHDAMRAALEAVETNLSELESADPDLESLEADPQPEFERARDAIDAHNEAVEDLDTSLTILNAYLR
jgi:chromosome segregation ATPase